MVLHDFRMIWFLSQFVSISPWSVSFLWNILKNRWRQGINCGRWMLFYLLMCPASELHLWCFWQMELIQKIGEWSFNKHCFIIWVRCYIGAPSDYQNLLPTHLATLPRHQYHEWLRKLCIILYTGYTVAPVLSLLYSVIFVNSFCWSYQSPYLQNSLSLN